MADRIHYNAEPDNSAYLFDAVLYPYRSLSRQGFFVFMAVLLGSSLMMSFIFWRIAAWPIIGLYGVDVVIVWLAFRATYRSGRDYETVRLSESELVIEDHSGGKGEKRWVFNPGWAQVLIEDRPDVDGALVIMSHGKGVQIGDFLTPEERADFARSLKTALAKARS